MTEAFSSYFDYIESAEERDKKTLKVRRTELEGTRRLMQADFEEESAQQEYLTSRRNDLQASIKGENKRVASQKSDIDELLEKI